MSTFDDILSKLRSSNFTISRITKTLSTSTPDDNLSQLRSQNKNIYPNAGFLERFDPDDITTYPINDIMKSGKFTPFERKQEYQRRGKSPSGVIDGEYNDMFRGNDEYNDSLRDWEANS